MDSRTQAGGDFSAFFEAQAGPLGRLARSLVHDAASAEDLVQETWTEYLRRPPEREGPLGGFLATLSRRLASKTHRSEERRRDRELFAARPESTPGPEEFAERAAALREVLEVVTTLREPFRTALWQRYFDDLPPREIARRSGESLATIKSRLQRGLELVRAELDRRHGGRRSHWIAALLPLPWTQAAPIGLGITGGFLMGTALKVGTAALVVACCAGWFLWSQRDPPGSGAGELVVQAQAPSEPESALSAEPQAPAADARTAVADPTAPVDPPLVVPDELSHPFLYVLVVRTLDMYGLPTEHPDLRIAPARSSLNKAAALMQADGWTTLVWRGKEPEMEVDVQMASSADFAGGRRVLLRAGTPCEIALLGPPSTGQAAGWPLEVSFTGGDGQFRLGSDRLASGHLMIGAEVIGVSARALEMSRFPHPHARFADRFVTERAPVVPQFSELQPMWDMTMREGIVLEGVQLSLGRMGSLQGLVLPSESAPNTCEVNVLVLDDRGEAAINALVTLGPSLDAAQHTAFTDDQGKASFASVEAGWWEARAGGAAGGLARERLFVEAPGTMQWTAHLDRGARVVGRVLDAEGKPLANVRVRYETTPDVVLRGTSVSMGLETRGGEEIRERGETPARAPADLRAPWVDEATPDAEGKFEFPNLPGGLGRLMVLPGDDLNSLPWIVEEGVLPGEHEYVLALPAKLASMRLRVAVPAGWEAEPLELRAVSESTGRGARFAASEDRLVCIRLAAGWYRVELGAGALGWHALGRHYLEEGADVDLGEFTPPPPAQVQVILPERPEGESHTLGLTFYLRRSDIDLRGDPRDLNGTRTLHMPAGEYWVFWTLPDGTARHQALSLQSGATTVLDLRDTR